MKKFIIKNIQNIEVIENFHNRCKDLMAEGDERMFVTDTYHTMDELYDHRINLFIALCRITENANTLIIKITNPSLYEKIWSHVWRSKLHSDGTSFEGWFILGIGKEKGQQITYHLPNDRWDETDFAEELEKAPEWDGHSSSDVLERLKNL